MKFLFIFFPIFAFAAELNYESSRCQTLQGTDPLQTWECHQEFVLESGTELAALAKTSEELSDYMVEVGTIKNLSVLIKDKLVQTHFETFKQKLIVAQGLGKDINAYKSQILSNSCLPTETKKSYVAAINELKQKDNIDVSKDKELYLKKIKSVFVEIARLQNLVELYENKPQFLNEKVQAQKDLQQFYQHYPMFLPKNSPKLSSQAELFTQRLLSNYPRPEDLKLHAHKTSLSINTLIDIGTPIKMQYPAPIREFRGASVYEMLHYRIHEQNFKDAMFDRLIPEMASNSVDNSLEGLDFLCRADPCETFTLIPQDIGKITKAIAHQDTRQRAEKYICECEIGRTEETLPISLHLGIAAGTIGMGIGCIAFPPLCIGTAIFGIVGASMGVSDYMTVSDNVERIEQETHSRVAVRTYYEQYQEDMLRLDLAESEQTTAALFMPLELLGGAGDIAVLGRAVVKGQNVLPPFKIGQSPNRINPLSPLAHIKSRQTLLRQFKDFDPATDEMRRAWIASARIGSAKKYLDIENGMLKRLNDIGDKDAVTALTNIHKKLVLDGVDALKRKYPDWEITMYSDFKSLRFAFNGEIPPNLEAEMTQIFTSAGDQVGDLVSNLINKSELQLPSKENPRFWFAGGFGETADQAGLASREARCRPGQICNFPLRDFSAPALQEGLREAAVSLDKTRQSIGSRLKNMKADVPLFSRHQNKIIPSPDVIEVVRKNLDKSSNELAALLSRRFGTDFDAELAGNLNEYIEGLKRFEPGLWVESRQLASLHDAAYGGFSADFTGMGSFNIEQVARDLTSHSEGLDPMLESLRKGEEAVTEGFNRKKEFFNRAAALAYGEGNDIRVVCSGDDCVAYPTQNLGASRAQQKQVEENFVRQINQSEHAADSFRLAFIPPNATREARSQLATHGELIEKAIRKAAFGSDAIPFSLSKKLTIATRMPSSLNRGQVEVIIAGTENLTELQRTQLQDYIQKAMQKSNADATDLARETNSSAAEVDYRLSQINFL